RSSGLDPILENAASGEQTLRSVIRWFVGLVASDTIFRQLLHRELLEGDDERLKMITDQVLSRPFEKISRTLEQVYPGVDAAFIGISAISIVLGHLELAPLRRYLGVKESGYSVDEMANRISNLLMSGVDGE
ncbi:MAG: hypothetical protein VW985_05165, partial [Gammaproteobacteria bacterium]